MSHRTCHNCGSKIIGGLCSWCDEEAIIMRQNPEYSFSEEFQQEAFKQEEYSHQREELEDEWRKCL